MDPEQFLSREYSRMEVYRILADCYYLPNKNLKHKLDKLSNHLKLICDKASDYVKRMKECLRLREDLVKLKVDHAKLFVGPYKLFAPPYGSVYLEGERRVMGESTMDAREIYKLAGLDVANDFKEAPDHIAVELEFVHFLIFKGIEALRNNDFESVFDFHGRQISFLKRHLGAWISDFTQKVEENAKTEFYRNLARATKVFITEDLEEFSENYLPGERFTIACHYPA